MCYELTGGTSWREQLPILAAVELLNISTYQSNYCFDEKAGVTRPVDRNNQFICSMLTFSNVISLIDSFDRLQPSAKTKIVSLFAQSNHEVYKGQFCDLNLLNLDRISDFDNLDRFLSVYAERCNLIAGSTFRACAAAALPNDPPPGILDALLAYLGSLGAAAQAINDLGDYIPHVTKDYALPFSDFQLGRLTLPTFLLHKAGLPLDEWRTRLRVEGSVVGIEHALTEAIRDLKLEAQVRRFVRAQMFPTIRSSLAILEEQIGSEQVARLWFAYPFIFESRLLRYFRLDHSRAWRE
jgi:geranylgeranyl pyrophosphate synthase